jgi:DNA-binding transcriptional ArsR family regulator
MSKESLAFAALADPTRRSLLLNLAKHSPRTATQLAEEYPISRQGILKHLNVLDEAGLVVVYQAGREKKYSPALEPLSEIDQFIEELKTTWDRRLLRLKLYVEGEPPRVGSDGNPDS